MGRDKGSFAGVLTGREREGSGRNPTTVTIREEG